MSHESSESHPGPAPIPVSLSAPVPVRDPMTRGAIIVQLGTALISAVMVYMIHRLDVNQDNRSREAAVQIREVRQVLATNTEDTAEKATDVKRALLVTTSSQDRKLDSIHQLVNSAMGSQLKVTAIALRRLANATGRSDDLEAATLAEKAVGDHELKQQIVDKMPKGVNVP